MSIDPGFVDIKIFTWNRKEQQQQQQQQQKKKQKKRNTDHTLVTYNKIVAKYIIIFWNFSIGAWQGGFSY